MRARLHLVGILILTNVLPALSQEAQHPQPEPKLFSAKTVFFEDRTNAAVVASNALAELKKWGRFQIVQDPKQADLIILISADPPKGGYVETAAGQTGTVSANGQIDADRVPTFNKLAPVRYAYLTVFDSATEEKLWEDSHQWGGLLTGFNSVGERLVKRLEKRMK